MRYQRDSEISLSELPDFRDGPNYLARGANTATVWDYHANLMPLLRDMELTKEVPVTSRYESRTGALRNRLDDQSPASVGHPLRCGVGHDERVAPVLGWRIAGRRKYKGHWPSYEERKPLIDCDAHQNFGNLGTLLQWVDPAHRDYLRHVGFGGFELPNYSTWSQPHGTVDNDSVPPDGEPPGFDYKTVRERLLDPFDVEYAVLTGEDILTISSLLNPQAAAAVATAYNRYLIDELLSCDYRLKGSLMVATQDVQRAAEEIRTFGDHPDVVQVLLPCAATSDYGDPRYHPIYEAAVEVGLPVALHVGVEELGMKPPRSATAYPGYYDAEWHFLLVQWAISHLISLVFYGVFEKYPELRVVVIEAGVTWLPTLLWNVDADWKALRAEVPWVKQRPGEIVREHVRLTTQPLDELDSREKLRRTLEVVDGLEDMLMFATGYPHGDYDRPDLVSRWLPTSWREKVMSENARALYGLPAWP